MLSQRNKGRHEVMACTISARPLSSARSPMLCARSWRPQRINSSRHTGSNTETSAVLPESTADLRC